MNLTSTHEFLNHTDTLEVVIDDWGLGCVGVIVAGYLIYRLIKKLVWVICKSEGMK